MMSLDEIKELNHKWQKDNNVAYEYNGTELQTLNGEHIGVDLMLSDEGLELQVCKVIGFNNQNEKMWETFAIESIDINKFKTDYELSKYLEYIVDIYEKRIKNDIDEEGFVINRKTAQSINGMIYKGIYVQYLEDTNTLIFTIHNEYNTYDDSDDIDTIVYRNYTQKEIEKHIDSLVKDYNIKKVLQKTIIENQQEKLTLGILKLKETHKTLKELSFSDCVLNEINNIIDDLKGLIEEEKYEKIIKESEK